MWLGNLETRVPTAGLLEWLSHKGDPTTSALFSLRQSAWEAQLQGQEVDSIIFECEVRPENCVAILKVIVFNPLASFLLPGKHSVNAVNTERIPKIIR